jgi:hypothetical protein
MIRFSFQSERPIKGFDGILSGMNPEVLKHFQIKERYGPENGEANEKFKMLGRKHKGSGMRSENGWAVDYPFVPEIEVRR